MMMEPVELAYLGIKHRLPNCSLVQFKEIFKDWTIYSIKDKGAVLIKDSELHVSIIPEYKGKWFTRTIFNNTVGKVIEKYGFAITSSLKDNIEGIKFIKRLGFEFEKEENNILYFKILRNKYVRGS